MTIVLTCLGLLLVFGALEKYRDHLQTKLLHKRDQIDRRREERRQEAAREFLEMQARVNREAVAGQIRIIEAWKDAHGDEEPWKG